MNILVMIGQLLLSLSILITLHEMGHFLTARYFKTKVEKFYLFFDFLFPLPNVLNFALWKKKIGDTEYGLGWFPLGGYVKIAGMIDESNDKEFLNQPPQPWEFRSKPAWQRLIIMLGGVIVNFLLGGLIYAGVLWFWGEEYLPSKNVKFGIYADSLGQQIGLRDGDKILAIGDQPFDRFSDNAVKRAIIIDNADALTIERDGSSMVLTIPGDFIKELSAHKNKDKSLFGARVPFIADRMVKDSPAERAGVKPGDRVIAFNDTPTPYFHEFQRMAGANPGKEVEITVLRADTDTLRLPITLSDDGKAGIFPRGYGHFFSTERKEYSLLQAFPAGFVKGYDFLAVQLKAFGQMFKGKIKASDSLGGFASIGQMFGSDWIWERFWSMTAALSIILAFMNLLPIPALDGGYVMFLLFEIVTRRKPSDRFMEWAGTVGFILLIGLMLWANGLDVLRGCGRG
ncbi:MAG: RIP metalloprotease RseP [Saprospiraceae bacterium]|nr:RIP metalloprotease RseP [Saprospiraceae bacterium]